jgi:hypothetical protein
MVQGDIMGGQMVVCVIMHNIIVKEKRDKKVYDKGWVFQGELVDTEYHYKTW